MDFSLRSGSHSRQLSAAVVKKLLEVAPGASISRRDFGNCPYAARYARLRDGTVNSGYVGGPPEGRAEAFRSAYSRSRAADVIVIGTPMNNFSVLSVFKAWIDHIPRVGQAAHKETLRYGAYG
ncbi:NAD(P)H-dependent oxidoreductase [Trinickia symbiotica]|uniref:NAD(P)H-dependent oxidoreductase n=1 Tax=Trinickia symbiotica TaxID=863227 RepID=UPI002158A4AB|nr:NAD(P)H-dependent oxidoreductase [Trinickia symbiotica]